MTIYPEFEFRYRSPEKNVIKSNASLRLLYQTNVEYEVLGEGRFRVPIQAIYPNPNSIEEAIHTVQHFLKQCKDTIEQAKVEPEFKI